MEKIALLVLGALVAVCHGCTIDLPWYARGTKEVDESRVHFSEFVVFGSITKNATEALMYKDLKGIFTVEFESLCSYKGGPVESTIFITGMGNMENKAIPECPAVEPKIGEQCIMFLKSTPHTNSHNLYEIEFKPRCGEIGIILDDLSMICGLELHYSTDVNECEDFQPMSMSEDCLQFAPPTSTQAPVVVTNEKNESTYKTITGEPPKVDNNNKSSHGEENTEETAEKPSSVSGSKIQTVESKNPTGTAASCSTSSLLGFLALIVALLV